MEGGYINEGGQLKTKNGQKYIINHRTDGFFVTKSHAIVLAALTLIVMAAIFLLTYFLLAHTSCSTANESIIAPESISQAGIFGSNTASPIAVQSDQSANQGMVLNEGWSPTLYTLTIQPHFSNATSSGDLIIDIVRDTNEKGFPPIVLDINNITITETNVYQTSSDIASPLEIKTAYGENNAKYIIDLNKVDKVDNVALQIHLKFISRLTDTLQGFYRVSYEDVNTRAKTWLASTQFSPIDARRAFPCFDRPDKKAKFRISVIREPSKAMALSNMPSERVTILNDGNIKEDFEVTPKMSSYLVAFIVSDLVNTNVTQEPRQKDLPVINIYTRKDVADMTKYAYILTSQVLPYFNDYFGIPFILPKIDMVAVPDFGFSAMENWGLCTFRESSILVPEDEDRRSSAKHTEQVSSIIAHELAHQWFGNLVTMKAWDDLWLKEGFSTYMSYTALNHIHPNWRLLDFFSINELQKSMEKDSDRSSHAISFPVTRPSDIRRIFDPISYSKGASIIRMMQYFLGERAFRRGIQEYLEKFKYANAVQDDLWEVLTQHGHKEGTLPKEQDIKKIMDSWTLQPGYPIVTVQRNGTTVRLTQQRYMLPKIDSNDKSRWHVPITLETKSNRTQVTIPSHWLNDSNALTLDNVVDADHWLYVNIDRAGYYRVNYDYNSWLLLVKDIHSLSNVTRAQLLDDALNLARAEVLSYDVPLTFLLRLRNEDVLSWAAAAGEIEYLTHMLNREPAYEHFRAIMRYIIKPIYMDIGFDEKKNESHVELMHRQNIVENACFYGHDWCTNRAQEIYRDWMKDKSLNLISPNLKSIVYCTALREGSFQEWYFAYNRYLETDSASEKEIILESLGCTTKPWLLAKYLNMTITPTSGIRKQDGARAFMSVAKNNVGYEIAFDFLVSHIKEISEYFGDGFSTLSKMIDSVTTYMNKEYQKDQFDKFAKKAEQLGLASVERSIQLAVEQVKNNIYWRSRSYYKLQGFLETLTRDLHINLY